MHRTGGATFGLHLNNGGNGSPDVGFTTSRLLVSNLTHRRRRGNRIDRNYLANRMGYMRCRRIRVNHYETASFLFSHVNPS